MGKRVLSLASKGLNEYECVSLGKCCFIGQWWVLFGKFGFGGLMLVLKGKSGFYWAWMGW